MNRVVGLSWGLAPAAAVVVAVAALSGSAGRPVAEAAVEPPGPMQGVNATGLITFGAGACLPDAVLLDCAGIVAHQLKGPGGAGFFAPYIGQWVQVNGAEQQCQPGQQYIDVVTINTIANPCAGPTPTPGGPPPTVPPPPPPATATPVGPTPTPGASNLATGRQLFASTTQPGTAPSFAADGDLATVWASEPGRDPYYAARNVQWIYIDLGADYSVQEMRMRWNAAEWRYARGYTVYAYLDYCGGWCRIASTRYGDGDDTLKLLEPLEARYWMLWLVNPALIGGHYELAEWDITGLAGVLTTNVAAGRGAVAQSSLPGFGAGGVTDGSDVTEWRSATLPAWIYVNLGTGVAVDKARLKWSLGQHATSFALYAWNGYGWIPLTARTTGAGGDEVVRFPAVRTQYVLLNALAGPGPGVGLREFEIYEWRPSPGPIPDVAGTMWRGLAGGGRPTIVPAGLAAGGAESVPEAPLVVPPLPGAPVPHVEE